MSFGHRFVLSICLLLASIIEIPGWFRFDIAPLVDPLSAYVAASR